MKLLQPPGDASRWFVLEKAGRIRTFTTANPANAPVWLDIRGSVDAEDDGGLLGMAFHPDYPAVREIYLYYTAPTTGNPMVSRISRFTLDNVTTPVNVVEQILLTVNQPYTNHKGGDIAFGADRLLYISLGDGGSGGDPEGHGQNTSDLLGSFLRIAVLGVPFSERYRIPTDNPFAASPRCGPGANGQPCPEIYAWGMRNPWRWSFDRQTGALWAGDVGQSQREEIDVIELGGNYGWRCREGRTGFNTSGCPTSGFVEPIFDYTHSIGASITGGFVYRGSAIPQLQGRYIFGDFVGGWVAALRDDGAGAYTREELFDEDHQISTFGQGNDGEIYFTDYGAGRIYRLVPAGGGAVDNVPNSLAATGCVVSGNPRQPAAGVIPYAMNAPFWSDGALKERWLAIPNGTRITIDAQQDFVFPPGTVLMKSFRIGTQLVETRLLMRHPDGVWRGYTYEWNDAQTAATRVYGGKTRTVQGMQWTYPSEGQCLQCHTSASGFSLGPEVAQLNRDATYPATGRTANQLTTLEHIGMFAAALPAAPANLPRLAAMTDLTQPAPARAKAWLHVNCSYCHRPGGLTPSNMDFRHATPLQSMNACNVAPTSGNLGIADSRRIAPGASVRSIVAARADRRDAWGMPPLGSSQVDAQGVDTVAAWIDTLASCTDTDNDAVDDATDNCSSAANANQRDTDGDGHGNWCDADFDESNVVNASDLAVFRSRFGTSNADADLDGDGIVNFTDLARFRILFGQPPGP